MLDSEWSLELEVHGPKPTKSKIFAKGMEVIVGGELVITLPQGSVDPEGGSSVNLEG